MQALCEQLWGRCLRCAIDFIRVFVVDRGFRDIREYLECKAFVAKMPDIIPSGESQLSDTLANNSLIIRLITKVRFVEVIMGILKFASRILIVYGISNRLLI